MRLILKLQMDNAAFEDGNDGATEAANILKDAAKHIERGDRHRGFRTFRRE